MFSASWQKINRISLMSCFDCFRNIRKLQTNLLLFCITLSLVDPIKIILIILFLMNMINILCTFLNLQHWNHYQTNPQQVGSLFYSRRLCIYFFWPAFIFFQFNIIDISISFNVENGYTAPDIEEWQFCEYTKLQSNLNLVEFFKIF